MFVDFLRCVWCLEKKEHGATRVGIGFTGSEENIKSVINSPMISSDLAFGITFLLQTGAGLLGNSSLLYLHLSFLFAGHKLKPTDLILSPLCLANTLVLLSKGVPQAMTAPGLKDFLGDMGCKLLFYLYRVARGTSLCATCLLSCFQIITVSSSVPRWTELKTRASDHIVSSCYPCWLLNLLLQIVIPLRVTGPNHDRNNTMRSDFAYCTDIFQHSVSVLLYALLLAPIDFMFLGLMVWSSGSMVFILYRHKKRVQHIHSKHLSHKTSPETRATHTILVLVSIFVSFYFLSSILAFYMALFDSQNVWLYSLSTLVAACFPSCSSFVLMNKVVHISRLSFIWGMSKINFPKT
nr:vomeronasal type-1 receptor 4-like [Loxodonta africana]